DYYCQSFASRSSVLF
nr:immunoglobulin light chain junction region [Macaca mulatta]MOW56591.1 immunoglobulin light chain junction region [Macaca mulatta]MOW57595.1 immunoglobulin light chain junction region [Macaca mulatta]MOW58507.1 immunoglobulin light chain junction region [Macaca mulatta]MOW58513.1 immunoglobulin light chain junction region [Macaca mulatta]